LGFVNCHWAHSSYRLCTQYFDQSYPHTVVSRHLCQDFLVFLLCGWTCQVEAQQAMLKWLLGWLAKT